MSERAPADFDFLPEQTSDPTPRDYLPESARIFVAYRRELVSFYTPEQLDEMTERALAAGLLDDPNLPIKVQCDHDQLFGTGTSS